MKRLKVMILFICATTFFSFSSGKFSQTDYYTPYCVDGHGWLNGRGCDGKVYTLDGSNQIGKNHELATKGHRWDNKYCRTGSN